MDQQRPFLYLTLFFLGFLIWSTWQQEQAQQTTDQSDGTRSGQLNQSQDNIPYSGKEVPTNVTNIPTADGKEAARVPAEKTAHDASLSSVRIRTDVLDLLIDLQGGTILQADLPTYPVSLEKKDVPVRIIDRAKDYAAQSGLIHRKTASGSEAASRAPNHYAKFAAEKAEYVLQAGQQQLIVPLVWTGSDGITVTKRFLFERGKFLVHVEQQIENQSSTPWVGNEYLQLTHGGVSNTANLLTGVQAYTGSAYYNEKYIKVDFGDIEDEKLSDRVTGGWAAMLEHYFVSAWVPPQELLNVYYTNHIADRGRYILGLKSPEKVINPGGSDLFKSRFYVGPAIQGDLEKIAKGLELTVDYGIFTFVSKPIFWMMEKIHSYVSNWGWTIILMTILIKILFFYPSAKSYQSMAKMKKMAPKFREINEKYKNDPQTKQKETFALYRKEKINPLGGCLPILIQLPVFMGLYWVLLESVELRQAPWILWYKDLSIMDPFFILPLIMGASMFIQQKLNPPMVQDPLQQKIFTYLPVVFTVLFLFFPAGLVLYWVVNNILSILQQWYITRKIVGDH